MTRQELLKLNQSRKHKVTSSIGVYSAYKWLRKRKWADIGQKITEHQFYYIIRQVNKALAMNLINCQSIKFPHGMGILELRKNKVKFEFRNNKVYTNLPIDWDRTIKLWCEDEESYKNRTLIKMEEKEIFRVLYNKSKANYKNQMFYQFKVNRELKRLLKNNIKEGNVDAFLLKQQ